MSDRFCKLSVLVRLSVLFLAYLIDKTAITMMIISTRLVITSIPNTTTKPIIGLIPEERRVCSFGCGNQTHRQRDTLAVS